MVVPSGVKPDGTTVYQAKLLTGVASQHALAIRLACINRHFDAPVLRPSGFSVVGRDRLGFSLAGGREAGSRYSLCNQIVGSRIRAALRQTLIVGVIPDVVGVSHDQQLRIGISVEACRELTKVVSSSGLNLSGVEREEES